MFRIVKQRAGAVVAAALIAVVAFVDAGSNRPRTHGQKPMFPVLSRLDALNTPEPGGVLRVLATITAWTPGEDIFWTLDVPPELQRIEGPAAWSGSLARGESRAFEIAFTVPDGAYHEITATARVEGRPGARSASTLPVDLGGFEGARATEKIVTGDGVTYIQYEGEVKKRAGADR